MEKKVTPLSWQTNIKNELRSENIGSDFILLDDFTNVPIFMYPFKLDMVIVMICTKGAVRGTIDLQPYDLKAPFTILVRPNQTLHYEYISHDFAGNCIILSKNFAPELLSQIDKPMLIASAVRYNPYAQLVSENLIFVKRYFVQLKRFMTMYDNPYRLEMVKHLTMAFFYWARPNFQIFTEATKQTRQGVLIDNFTQLLRDNFRRERKTAFYAGKLNLTPKYLSQAIKAATGKSASGWIDDFVMLEAKALLKSTNMTIQQISDELNFPSQSFFGKYFKRNEGVSPKEYRKD